MRGIVKINNDKPVVSTFDLFSKMGYKEHRVLKRVISDNLDYFQEYGFLHMEVQKPTGKEGGRPTEAYLLNEDHFILLVLLAKNSAEAVALKVRLAREFKRMRATLANIAAQQTNPDWVNARKDGKAIYFEKSTVIKDFVEYATAQGSKSAKKYYMSLAKMENSALFFIEKKYKNLREIMTIKQLMQIATADQIVEKALVEVMQAGRNYKEGYKLSKERVTAFAEIIGKSHLHDTMLEGETTKPKREMFQ